MGRVDQDLIYIPEGKRLPVLEFDKLDSFEDTDEFEVYYEKYLGYFENDPVRYEQERNDIEAWVIKHKRYNWEDIIARNFKGE